MTNEYSNYRKDETLKKDKESKRKKEEIIKLFSDLYFLKIGLENGYNISFLAFSEGISLKSLKGIFPNGINKESLEKKINELEGQL